ncbi:FAD-dependent oxidoreductase [Sphingomonas baiyangensis]|uniref:FAD-dependent oxidoreductase n=1 Tax=Sphingomonas baiyangensis TaxID=2572576 RepID=A0A4U1L1Z7_9SPHN|nr:FAD-dependent oxidoreductase [Sphingomonas baiyangensis]TKD49985.1 FAD-dependent oxidoreductase [Sphingomonas baiyangensis]
MAAIRFGAQVIAAQEGESVLAALAGAGMWTLGEDARRHPRGAWCGMGACQACLVTIDGVPAQRACMAKVRDGMAIEPAAARIETAADIVAAAPRRADALPLRTPDLLVVGGGPAGLAAATTARAAGIEVLLIDERRQPGGQYFKQRDVATLSPADAQQREGAARIDAALEAGVEMLAGATVWGAFPGPELVADTPDGPLRVRPSALVLATGAIERGWPVPGWTLPGVIATGAAQTLWRTARRAPPGRIVIAGNGPLNLQLAAELLAGGAKVAALVEAAPAPGPRHARALLKMSAAAPSLVAQGAAYRARLAAARVPLVSAAQVAAVRAADAGLIVRVDTGREIAADTLCLGYGLAPADELARALGCAGPVDDAMRTSVDGIWRVGDGVAIGGAHVAAAQGMIAGAAVAARFGRTVDCGAAKTALARHRRFQSALWRLYAPALPLDPSSDADTVVCRCEGVTMGRLRTARDEGCTSMSALKLATRAGMGACQGRYCATLLAGLTDASGEPGLAPRVPVRPVRIGDLAR